MNERRGKVYLVGAGPGSPDLITMRGADALRTADVVIYDYLVSPEILRMARSDAQLIYVGKRGGNTPSYEQHQINGMLVKYAQANQCVVRLKGGDPFIFGRGGEEAEALATAGVEFEIVPGVTSAIAAPAYAGIPLTHRQYGSFVTFLTGHEDLSKNEESAVPWDELAKASRGRGTIVMLMATRRLRENLARLIAGGLDADTPAAAIQWATTAAQKTVIATLGSLAEETEHAGLAAPAVVVIGESVRLRDELRWFENMPLSGRRIVVTRAEGAAQDFARRLRAFGAEAIEFPVIATAPPDNYELLDRAIGQAESFDWIVFTSATGVGAFFDRMRRLGQDIRKLGAASLAAIGPATADRLRTYGLNVAAVPTEYRAEALIGAIGTHRIAGKRILIPRAQSAREILPEMLAQAGAREVIVAPAYKTVLPRQSAAARIQRLAADGAIDLVTFTSSSTVANFCSLTGLPPATLKAGVIGPITEETARQYGFNVAVRAATYTVDNLIECIVEYFGSSARA